jgi:hypothetical protein
VRALTHEIDRRLKSVSIHLHEGTWAHFLDDLEHLYPLNRLARVPPSLAALRHRKRIADAMNYFLKQDRTKAAAVAAAIDGYQRAVRAHGLAIDSPILRSTGLRSIGLLLARTSWILFGFIAALPGTLFHFTPFFLTRGLAKLMQSNLRATFALSRLGVGLPVYVVWYGLACWPLLEFLPPPWLALLLGAMPFLGVLALRYSYFVRRTLPPLAREWRMLAQPGRIRALRYQRDDLRLKDLAEQFGAAQKNEAARRQF